MLAHIQHQQEQAVSQQGEVPAKQTMTEDRNQKTRVTLLDYKSYAVYFLSLLNHNFSILSVVSLFLVTCIAHMFTTDGSML